ncbi:MAG: phage tail protein [Clostridium sp.]|nr:phage tail protein [Clostridium sp.]
MLYVFNKDDEVLEILQEDDFFNDSFKQQINGEWIYSFHVDKKYSNIVKENKIGFFDEENRFQLFIIDDTEEVFNYSKKYDLLVTCLHDFYNLRYNIIEDRRIINGSARQALEKCLEGTSYFVGEVAELGLNNINFYFTSSLAGINEIINAYGGELDFRIELNENKTSIGKKYIDIKYRLGEDTGLRFTFDLNLEEVKKKEYGDIITVLYGRGSSLESGEGHSRKLDFADIEWKVPNNPINKPIGQKYIENIEAIKKYGRKAGIFENGNIKTPEELISATYEKLQECGKPKVSYTASIKDLSNIIENEHLKIRLGDSIIILDEEYNLLIEARIIEQIYSISNPRESKIITLGNFLKGASDIDDSSKINDRLDKIESKPNDIKDSNFPDTLPVTPTLRAKEGFAVIALEWTCDSKPYYLYELYASRIENFNPDLSNLIFKGQANYFIHEVKPEQTWYYRIRVINTHNKVTPFSNQVSGYTFKVADGTEYFESAAIKDALIGELRLDRGWVGEFDATLIRVGTLQSKDGKVSINLDNGIFTLTNDSGQVIIDGEHNIHKIIKEGTTTINFRGKSITKTVAHNLGYRPAMSAYQMGANGTDEFTALPALTWSDNDGITAIIRARCDSKNLYFDFNVKNNYQIDNLDIKIKYFLYKEVAF